MWEICRNEHLEVLEEVGVTEKLGGENATRYHDYLHARSVDVQKHMVSA